MSFDEESRIVLTGPSGWIGSAMLAAIAARRDAGWERNLALFGSSERMLTAPDGARLKVRKLTTIHPRDIEGAHVIHLAYLTKEKAEQLGAAEFFSTNEAIDDALEQAMEQGAARSLFVASSGAALLADAGRDRHLYGTCKLRQEDRFLALGVRRNLPVLVGRIFNLAGAHINKLRSYAVSSFVLQALESGRIRIDATIPVYRSYLHIADLCTIVLGALERGMGRSKATDLCGHEALEMGDIASIVAESVGIGRDLISRPPVDFSRSSVYLGDPTLASDLALELGFRLAGFPQQAADTAAFIRSLTPAARSEPE